MIAADDAVLAATMDVLADVVLVVTEDDTVVWRRLSSTQRLIMAGDGDVVGRPLAERIHPEDFPTVFAAVGSLRSGERREARLQCRVFDAADPTLIHDVDVQLHDARPLLGITALLVAAVVRDTRRAHPEHVHGDDFSLADAAPVGLALLAVTGRLVFANSVFRTHLGLGSRTSLTVTSVLGLHDLIADARLHGEARQTIFHRGLTLRTVARRFGDDDNLVLSTVDLTGDEEDCRHANP